jgi:hypothetical protein
MQMFMVDEPPEGLVSSCSSPEVGSSWILIFSARLKPCRRRRGELEDHQLPTVLLAY